MQINPNKSTNVKAGTLKRSCVHLGDSDRAALAIIRAETGWPSDALTIRQALRFLAKRINDKKVLADEAKEGMDA
jgi:hypothetical protein